MEPQQQRLKEQYVPMQNQTISRLRKMHRRRISRLKLIIFPQWRANKKIIFRFKTYSSNWWLFAKCRESEDLKKIRDFENLWHSWNVNRSAFKTLRVLTVKNPLTISHLQLDGTWSVRNRFCNKRRECESTEKYIYIHISASRQEEWAVLKGKFEDKRLTTLQKIIEELDTIMNRD